MRSGRALALASILVFAACGNGSSDDGFVGPNDGGTPDGGVEGGGGEGGTLPDGGAVCGLTNAAKVVSVDGLKSASHPKAQATESATITFDTKTNVNEVLLPPTVIGGKSAGFPVEFTIAWNDGTTWQDALSFTHMAAAADGSCAKLSLPDGVDATAIKLTATVLGADGASYDLSLDGIAATHDTALDPVDAKLASATSSSVSDPATDWAAAHAIDGNPATVFGSAVHGSASSAESLTVTFADATVDHVTITPRYAASGAALGFPTSFSLTAIELGFLTDRRQAFENLAMRIDLDAVRGVVTTMIQTEKYGTPLASALRVLSAEFRNERMMRAEEKAARLPAIMTVPLILFILPVLFIVILGPAACSIADAFSGGGPGNVK